MLEGAGLPLLVANTLEDGALRTRARGETLARKIAALAAVVAIDVANTLPREAASR